MWLCEAKPQEAIVKIGQTLKKRLGIDDKVVRKYFDFSQKYFDFPQKYFDVSQKYFSQKYLDFS